MTKDPFGAAHPLSLASHTLTMFRLDALERRGLVSSLSKLPFTVRVILESAVRRCDGFTVTEQDVAHLASWSAQPRSAPPEVPFSPARVVLQDFTGVPVVVDLAAMRSAVARLGGDPTRINPLVPVDLVIDHSVQVDDFGSSASLLRNEQIEFTRNEERYRFLSWGQRALKNFRVVPPSTGIVHQVNLEYLAKGVLVMEQGGRPVAMPDTLVGTDSHTTMINGLGVLGWGVGGIEAEAVMLGQPLYMLLPEVIGVRFVGQLPPGVTATDLTLTVTQRLRKRGVVDKLVEFVGDGLASLTLEDRATIANMAPEYGATCGFFPVDDETLSYLRRTGRTNDEVALVEKYYKEQGLFRAAGTAEPEMTDVVEIDLSTIEPSVAGPKRPHDRLALGNVASSFREALTKSTSVGGFGVAETDRERRAAVQVRDASGHVRAAELGHGAVVIAAITSCTNTSNPSVLVAAGLVARKAAALGLRPPAYVKTSLAPGSRVVTEYLRASGLLADLDAMGFHVVGYGCTTCIGNSGPVPDAVAEAITSTAGAAASQLTVAAVLSGNRNFEGRIHPLVKANYLASPPLVVAYALAGRVDIDLTREPLGHTPAGTAVYLRELWPTASEVLELVRSSITPTMFQQTYAKVFDGSSAWRALGGHADDTAESSAHEQLYRWEAASTYIQEPPFFLEFSKERAPLSSVKGARVLALLGDSVTTDHISPAGDIAVASPAGEYLNAAGVNKAEFNSYGSRRGNDRVMVRGTFANIRLKNLLVPGTEGGLTRHFPSGQKLSIYEAASRYQAEKVPLIILAGKEYGSGSSRDWAAKGTLLLGVRAVIAESFERIHRSNLVGMGVLPLVFEAGQSAATLGLDGSESFAIEESLEAITPRQRLTIVATSTAPSSGDVKRFHVVARLDSPVDVSYFKHGGILPAVLRELLARPS
jgi:aconitate hydratase